MYFDDSIKPIPEGTLQQFDEVVNGHHPTDDWLGYEELILAIKCNQMSRIEFLLDRGCQIYRPGSFSTPLHLAVEKKCCTNIVTLLLKHGAKVDSYNENKDTALHHAFIKKATKLAIHRMLMTYLRENYKNLVNLNGITYLHIACAKSKLCYVKNLLYMNSNDDVNAQVNRWIKEPYAGFTALHFAVECGNFEIASFLLKNKANIYALDADNSTPLHLACRRRNIQMIDLLLTYDHLRENCTDRYNISHFMVACMSSDHRYPQEYLEFAYKRYKISALTLISEETSIYASSCPKYTPLHFAAEWGRFETVKLLLAYKPDVICCVLNGYQETPLMLAQKRFHINICELLQTQNLKDFERKTQNHTVELAPFEGTLVKSNLNITKVSTEVCQTVDDENQNYSLLSNVRYTSNHQYDVLNDFEAVLYSKKCQ